MIGQLDFIDFKVYVGLLVASIVNMDELNAVGVILQSCLTGVMIWYTIKKGRRDGKK